ncbi:MAG: serine/threonine protein kinase [Alphaproteobacteria bacterium]|nr:serine/threonine protein kinase [Alphaproteobacteria bacterium]
MLSPGDRVAGRYTVLRALGAGGMGGVYEIEGDALANRLALKVIHNEYAEDARLRSRFQREARIQASLDHPSIARVFDLVEHDGSLAIVMEFVDAPTLRDALSAGRLPLAQVRGILTEIASALDAAHDAGIVHRDIKPENVFVLRLKDGRVRCKLIDFGIARQMEDGGDQTQATRLTHDQSFVGTYTYASPEQITRAADVDARSDLYSLGVLLWEMLSGVLPYGHLDSAYSVQVAVVNEPLPALPPDVPGDLAALVAELTRKAPEERPQSAQEVLDRLTVPPNGALSSATVPESAALRGAPLPRTVVEGAAPLPARPPPPRPTDALVSSSVPPMLTRLMARTVDEFFPQLTVLTCIGVLAYPVLVAIRGTTDGQSKGQAMFKLRTVRASDGEPASPNQMIVRNVLDLFLLQVPLLGVTWPVSWLAFPLPLFAGLWLSVVLFFELLIASLNPGGRRLVDYLCGTRVARV